MSGRKRPSYSFETKPMVIWDLANSELTQSEIARKHRMSQSTVPHYLKNRGGEIEAIHLRPIIKRTRRVRNKDVEVALLKWVEEAKAQNVILTKSVLQERARFFAHAFGEKKFIASNSWFSRFKQRNCFVFENSSVGVSTPNEKKYAKSGSSEQNDEDANSGGNEVVVPDVEMRCSGSSEMETQSGASTSLMNNSEVLVKQEIIETEEESSFFDDSSLHSSLTDGPAETQFDSASCLARSESSNSTADTLSVGQTHDVAMAQTMPLTLGRVKPDPDIPTNSCDRSLQEGVLFSDDPPDLNTAGAENSSKAESTQPRISYVANSSFPSVSNVTDPKSSSSTEPIQPGGYSDTVTPTFPQVLNTSSLGSSMNNEYIDPAVPPNSNPSFPPRDKFDAYGEFVASKLRNLDSKSCTFVQTAFADLIFKAELGMFLNRGNENNPSAPSTNDNRKDTLTHNQSERVYNLSGKENIQPTAPSHMGPHFPPDFSIAGSGNSQRNEAMQPPHITNPSLPPVLNNTGPNISVRNEPIQPRMPHAEMPPFSNVTIPTNSSVNNFPQARVSSYVGPPSLPPVLNSFDNVPIQSRVPFHMRPRDEFDAYGEFAASKLRTLDPRSCAFVQTAFADLIFEAELGRFLSEGERSIFANRTNEILRNMPPANTSELGSLRNVVSNLSRYETQPQFNFAHPGFYARQVPPQVIPNLHFVPR